jgi:hypothetical protein
MAVRLEANENLTYISGICFSQSGSQSCKCGDEKGDLHLARGKVDGSVIVYIMGES